MNRNVNEHKFDRLARRFANSIGGAGAVILAVGLVIGACMGCQALIVDTGRQIVQGK